MQCNRPTPSFETRVSVRNFFSHNNLQTRDIAARLTVSRQAAPLLLGAQQVLHKRK